jgi:hypothetical protein
MLSLLLTCRLMPKVIKQQLGDRAHEPAAADNAAYSSLPVTKTILFETPPAASQSTTQTSTDSGVTKSVTKSMSQNP